MAKGALHLGARFGGQPMTSVDSGVMVPQRGRITADDGGHRDNHVDDKNCPADSFPMVNATLRLTACYLRIFLSLVGDSRQKGAFSAALVGDSQPSNATEAQQTCLSSDCKEIEPNAVHSPADSSYEAFEALNQLDAALSTFLRSLVSHVYAPLSRVEQRRHYMAFVQARIAGGCDRATALAEATKCVADFKAAMSS